MAQVMDLYLIYEFLKRLVKPFHQWDAFKTGVIDANGKVIVKKDERTTEQNRSWGYYDRLIANLKKLIAKLPAGKTRIASFAAALLLLKENDEIDPNDMILIESLLQKYMSQAEVLSEEIANVVGSGHIAGVGVGDDGELGVDLKRIQKQRKEIEKKRKEIIDHLKGIH